MYESYAMLISCLLLAGTSFISSGCSVLGYRLGAALDGGKPGQSVQIQEINASIPWDAKVVVLMKDSSTAKGGYRGITYILDEVQTAHYDVDMSSGGSMGVVTRRGICHLEKVFRSRYV
jgi:hypothetical protein